MSDHLESQYGEHPTASTSQNDSISRPQTRLNSDGLTNFHQQSRQVSQNADSAKQEMDCLVPRVSHATQSHDLLQQPGQESLTDSGLSSMVQFGTTAQDSQIHFHSEDAYDFVPSNTMPSTGMAQNMLMGAGSGLIEFGNAFPGINMQQHRPPGEGHTLLDTRMSDQSHMHNMASPVPTDVSPMLQDFSQDNPITHQYMQQSTGYASGNVPNMMNSMHNSPVNLYFGQQGQPMQMPRSATQPIFRNQQWMDGANVQHLQSPGGQSVQVDPRQQQELPRTQYIKPVDRLHTLPFTHQNFDSSQLRIPPDRRLRDESGQIAQALRQRDQAFKPSTSATHHPQMLPGNFQNAYSSSGFDVMTILMRVATRRNPQISLGAVDLSCAFTICDVSLHDLPIVYCSENFERMTGYNKHDILGRNCRFLQAPDGRVQAGVKRQYVDDDSVLKLKNLINAREEVQVSLINYRKGGQPFMNLLTMIPIPWDADEIKYYVGFQVDLVEQPHSVHSRNQDGSYQVNYQRGLHLPRYISDAKKGSQPQLESGQTISREDVSTVLTTVGNGDSELANRIWDKVLLENTDDVVFVLSLKGLFLYLSPSSNTILEYQPGELLGTPLSSIAHPSDIVPVMRELKDALPTTSIDIVFRVRRKNSGYMWFEGYGSLHTDQIKGRKSVVLVGRERPVYTLSQDDLLSAGSMADNEIWSKLSTSGMFLFVASNARQLLDRLPHELLGTSFQAIMRSESQPDFGRILDIVRTGKRARCKHNIVNKRGQVLQAFSTFYPGDAAEGSKPTFIIAQTRVLKYTRPSSVSYRPQTQASKLERQSFAQPASPRSGSTETPVPIAPSRKSSSNLGSTSPHQSTSANSPTSPSLYMTTFESAATHSSQHGLRLGHQDAALASSSNLFSELKTTRSTSWQYELRQMEKSNRLLAEEMQSLLAARKKRKRRKGGAPERCCSNCGARSTPEWRRGPSGARDLCNSCGLRWAKQQGRISPRTARSVASAVSGSASPVSVAGSTTSVKRDMASPGTVDAASASRGPSIQGTEYQGANKVAKRDGAGESPLLHEDAMMADEEAEEDTESEDEDEGEEPQSAYRHSGHPNAGTVLDNSIVENTEGEKRAEEDMDVGD